MKQLVNLRLFTIGAAVAIVHFVTGLVVMFGHANWALKTTPLNLISFAMGYNTTAVGAVLISTALLALVPYVSFGTNRARLIGFILPQQGLLVMHFLSIMGALVTGHYPDGYVPNGGSIFIFVDQIWLMTFIFWHSIEYWSTISWAGHEEKLE